MECRAAVEVLNGPKVLAPGIAAIGPIPRHLFLLGRIEENALAVNLEGKGIVLFVGCGHQGVAKLLERAAERRTLEAIGLLQRAKPGFVALSPHDSSEWAIGQFRRAFGNAYHDLEAGRDLQL